MRRPLLWTLLLTSTLHVSLANTSASPSSTAIAKISITTDAELDAERAAFVRETLRRRLAHVCSDRRSRDFAKWVEDRGDPGVFSMHGIDNQEDRQRLEALADAEPGKALQATVRDDPFADNRLNLDLVLDPSTPPARYQGNHIHLLDHKRPSILQLWLRAMRLGIHFAPVWSTMAVAVVSPNFRERVWYSWLANSIASSGAAWIKWGQWSSTRNDMFPDALCDELAKLHADAPAHDWDHSAATMESTFGLAKGTLDQVFEEFERRPIASGSIAQVHKAVLDGKLVAVKIRHPRVAELIDMDFRLMTLAAKLCDWIPGLSWLHIRDSVEQFSHTMAAQSDLHVEAHHLEVLNYNFRGWSHVRFPHPFYASSAVIIETFEPGRIVTGVIDMYNHLAAAIDAEANTGMVVEEEGEVFNGSNLAMESLTGADIMPIEMSQFLVTTGLDVYLKMLLVDNLLHSDLHPGNIMVNFHRGVPAKDSSGPLAMVPHDPTISHKRLRRMLGICLVDAGMVAQLSDEESSTFIGLLASLGEGNGRDAALFALRFSIENNLDEETCEAFASDMEALFAERCRGYGTDVDVGHVLRGVLGLIRKYHIRIDANFATLVVNCLCVESLGRQLFPKYNVLDAAKPLLRTYRNLCYEPDGTPKPEARQSRLTKFWLSVMYLRKKRADRAFFKREAKRIRERAIATRLLLDARD